MNARALAVCAAVAALAACRPEAPPPTPAPKPGPTAAAEPGAGASASSASARRYTVRAEVVRLPQGASRELGLRHEAIDDFADRDGKVVGMAAMVMPFPVDPGVSLDGIAVGDKVRARIAVDWAQNRFALESIEKLPPDTALHFGPAKPAGAAEPHAH